LMAAPRKWEEQRRRFGLVQESCDNLKSPEARRNF
jgi:hypothetical protein